MWTVRKKRKISSTILLYVNVCFLTEHAIQRLKLHVVWANYFKFYFFVVKVFLVRCLPIYCFSSWIGEFKFTFQFIIGFVFILCISIYWYRQLKMQSIQNLSLRFIVTFFRFFALLIYLSFYLFFLFIFFSVLFSLIYCLFFSFLIFFVITASFTFIPPLSLFLSLLILRFPSLRFFVLLFYLFSLLIDDISLEKV